MGQSTMNYHAAFELSGNEMSTGFTWTLYNLVHSSAADQRRVAFIQRTAWTLATRLMQQCKHRRDCYYAVIIF